MKSILFVTGLLLLSCQLINAQNKFITPYQPSTQAGSNTLGPLKQLPKTAVKQDRASLKNISHSPLVWNPPGIKSSRIGQSIWIVGTPSRPANITIRHKNKKIYEYLHHARQVLGVQQVESEYQIVEEKTDELQMTHTKLQQRYRGIPIFGGEIIVHTAANKVTHLNGVSYATPTDLDVEDITVNQSQALQIAERALKVKSSSSNNQILDLLSLKDEVRQEIYFKEGRPHLVWHWSLYPSHLSHWEVFVDVKTGDIIDKYSTICQLDHQHDTHNSSCSASSPQSTSNLLPPVMEGPAMGRGTDLNGNIQDIHSYESGGDFFLIDASRDMFQNIGDADNNPSGVIWTLDTESKKPDTKGYSGATPVSPSADWDNPIAVSAHINGSIAYEYFRERFQRNSIDGIGGSVLSFINVVDEEGAHMDNAFWNGAAMFYGNGLDGFVHLAGGLDVAGHEMSHGVIQNTAGLVYMGEAGALNESFADVFGVLIENEDWQIGEDVVKPQVFTSGALRNLADPHNGGSSLNDRGYQPRTYEERYTGSQDNGGVHINSGIPNWAFFKIANSIGVAKAEAIYFRTLSNYLTRSSQFVDLRLGTVRAATDLHGANSAEVQAINTAFDEVGILAGAPTQTQEDVVENPGQDIIFYVEDLNDKIHMIFPDGSNDIPISSFTPMSRVSVTDDGSFAVYVSDDQILRSIIFDWETTFTTNTLTYEENTLENNPQSIWRNVVVSKDGSRIAAIRDQDPNVIQVYDYGLKAWNSFELYNPTYTEGISTGDVQRADAMEFDFTGEFLMYDSESIINTSLGEITFWDIGFLNVFDNASNNWSDGSIFKLIGDLPENVSIGNPTFSKNSPYIIAFDYIESVEDILGETFEYYVYGANLETGDVNPIIKGTDLAFPSYSKDDNKLLFDSQAQDFLGNSVPTLYTAPIGADKISFAETGDFEEFKQDAYWSNWFGIGERALATSIRKDELADYKVQVFPNPTKDHFNIQFDNPKPGQLQIQSYNVLGQQIYQFTQQVSAGESLHQIDASNWNHGLYFIELAVHGKRGVIKVSVE